jgi:hypothetical protein
MHIADPLVPDPWLFEVEIAIGWMKQYKSPGSNQILAELIKAGGEMLQSEIHELINSTWNKEELPQQWKESLIAPVYKKNDKTGNYQDIMLLSTSYKIVFSIFLSRLSLYIDEIMGGSTVWVSV